MGELHADARSILAGWVAPNDEQEMLRRSFLELLARREDAMWRSCEPDHLTSSALIVRGDHVLLVHHSKAAKWLQTGGHCEPTDLTLADAALREASEESGIPGLSVDPVPLQLSRHAVPFCTGGHHLDVQFLVTAPAGSEPSVSPDEDDAQWFPLDPTAIPEPTDQDVRDLIAAATRRRRGTP